MFTEKIRDILEQNNINFKSKFLCTVSGGIDSICMINILKDLNLNCSIAHCNFNLRGEEADGDEKFVIDFAKNLKIECFTTSFDTNKYSTENGISIQMAARDLRYEWFNQLCEKHNFKYICIAHNSDDVIETMFNNLARGTGITGISGMQVLSKNILRPLIHFSRKNIEEYIDNNNLQYREDSSNAKTKYSRNLIRHEIIPLFEKINPSFRTTMIKNANNFSQTALLQKEASERLKNNAFEITKSQISIEINKYLLNNIENGVLNFTLRNLGMSNNAAYEVIKLVNSESGKYIKVKEIEATKDRENIVIRFKEYINNDKNIYSINTDKQHITSPINLEFENINNSSDFKIIDSHNLAFIDADKLHFPLTIRRWRNGDRFMPLGMKNYKKLSIFFRDIKLNKFQKDDVWLLCNLDEIVWVIGYRIDDRYKVTEDTKSIFKLCIKEKATK